MTQHMKRKNTNSHLQKHVESCNWAQFIEVYQRGRKCSQKTPICEIMRIKMIPLASCLIWVIFKKKTIKKKEKKQTFDVTLEELRQDTIWGQLVKHTAEELLGHTCYISWDQHTAKHHMEHVRVSHASHILINYKRCRYLNLFVWRLQSLIPLSLSREIAAECQPERSQSSRLGLGDELCMSSKSELWNFI